MEDHTRTLTPTSEKEAMPNTPHFDNPQLSELPEPTAAKPQPPDCIPKPDLPRTPGLLDYSLGILTGVSLALLVKALVSDDDTTTPTEED